MARDHMHMRPAAVHLLAIAVGVGAVAFLAPWVVRTVLKVVYYAVLVPAVTLVCVLSTGMLVLFVASARADKRDPPIPLATLQAKVIRPLAFATRETWPETQRRLELEATAERARTADPVSSRLDSILGLIRNSFIQPWYARISPSPAFPNAVDRIILHALGKATVIARGVDWPTVVVARMLPIMTAHFEHYKSIQHLASPLSSGALPLPLPARPHPALTARHLSPEADLPAIEAHLRSHIERALPSLLPEADQTAVVMVLVREIVLGAIVMPVFQMLCDPDFWNRQVIEQGAKYIHEKNQVNKVLSALSAVPQAGVRGSPRGKKQPPMPTITINSTVKQFDEFMRSIPRLHTLGEARRLRSDVDRELRYARTATFPPAAGEDKLRTARRVQRYIHRLERARGQVDRRIAALSGTQVPVLVAPAAASPAAPRVRATLYAIIANPACLAYWLEYMERRGRSHLVQFWLTVEGFKDPLEATGGLGVEDELAPRDSTVGEDIAFLYATYFATNVATEHTIVVSPHLLETITRLAQQGGTLNAEDVRRAKRAVNDAQKAVYLQMEEDDWPAFQKSELYLKALGEMKSAPPRLRGDRAVSYSPPASPTALLSPPLPTRSTSENASRRPYLVNGSFAPAAPTPAAASTSTTLKEPELVRRVSGESVVMSVSASGAPTAHRRSIHLDELFGAEEGSPERNPLFAENAEDEEAVIQAGRMEAIQAALNEIIAEDTPLEQRKESSPDDEPDEGEASSEVDPLSFSVPALPERHPLSGSKLTSRSADDLQAERERHEAPLGRVSPQPLAPARRRIVRRGSTDSTLHQSTKSIFADSVYEAEDQPEDQEIASADVQIAAPGDMDLSDQISQLDSKITNLITQESLLATLVRQAELTGNQKELRLLERSQSSLQRERRTAEFQVAQFRQQEEEHRLDPARTRVRIPTTSVSVDQQIVLYQVEISQVQDGRTLLSWTVVHRYSEFWDLDRALHDLGIPLIRAALSVELPGKRLVPSLTTSMVEARRAGLERYLQNLVRSPVLCESPLVRNFLSHAPKPAPIQPAPLAAQKLVRSLYKSVASTYESSGPNMIDMLSQTLTRQLTEVAGGVTDLVPVLRALQQPAAAPKLTQEVAPSFTAGAKAEPPAAPPSTLESKLPAALQPLEGESPAGFTGPICDLFIELFDLKENWVRRQAIVIILQQVLGGTIERKCRDSFRTATDPVHVEKLLQVFQDTMWPGGERRPPSAPRTDMDILDTRFAASRSLGMLIPDVAANMMGRGNARRAANMLWGSIQDVRMNQHLVLTLFDEIFAALS